MSDEIKDGGPAYPAKRLEPVVRSDSGETVYLEAEFPGMSLRDWFATQALAGIMANPEAAG